MVSMQEWLDAMTREHFIDGYKFPSYHSDFVNDYVDEEVHKSTQRTDSEFYNENTIVGEVIEDDGTESESDGPAFNELAVRRAARRREFYGDTPYSSILGRPYAGEATRNYGGSIDINL